MAIPVVGDALPKRGNRASQKAGILLLSLFGWRIVGSVPNVAKAVIIAAPHTSNWDFVLGMVAMFAVGIQVSWLGKHTFFRWPAASFLRWLGGIPVDRRSSHGVVTQIVAEFKQRDTFILGIAPEGTRKKVRQWKTGFYHIAYGANVPIVPIAFDYGRKVVSIGPAMLPGGDITVDMSFIQSFYQGVAGRNPHQF
jgi:1-acyl-sn-glycerol-3-phosphate acyltransferase